MLEKQGKNAPAKATGSDNDGVSGIKAERAAWEAEKMTRRAALARVGLRFGAAALAAFTVDDLARATMRALDRQAQDGKIAGAVASELRSAGVSFADGKDPSPDDDTGVIVTCDHCDKQWCADIKKVADEYVDCLMSDQSPEFCVEQNKRHSDEIKESNRKCMAAHCSWDHKIPLCNNGKIAIDGHEVSNE